MMDAQTLNQFLYNLHYKVEAMEQWAQTVNDSVTDHAVHIDNAKVKSMAAFRACQTNEKDTRTVMGMVQANDDALKAQVQANDDALKAKFESVVSQIEATMVDHKETMKKFEAAVDTKLRELQTTMGAQGGQSAPPGDSSSSAHTADLANLRAELFAMKQQVGQHEQNPAHLLEPAVLMQRLTAMENAIGALQRLAQATTAAPEPPPGMRPGAGTFGANFGGNLEARFNAARNDDDSGSMPQQQHDRGSMPQARGPFNMASGDVPDKLRLDPKLARLDKHLYLDNAPETWHKNVRTYLVGQHIDMKPFLSWIEGRGHSPITAADLESDLGLMMTLDPMHISRELWSWLNLSLEKSASAQQTFHNIEELNGAEAPELP